MQTPDPSIPTEEKEPKKRRALFIMIVQSLAIVILGWLYWSQTVRVETEIKEKIVYIDKSNGLQSDLALLKDQFLNLQTEDVAMKQQLQEKITQIEDLQKQAEKHKNDAYIIGRLKKETETLRTIMKSFVVTIDSLNTLNQTITAEKKKVEEDLSSEKGKTSQLSKDKEELQGVVAIGSMLRAQNVVAQAVRFKSGGKKEDMTTKAKKAEKIKVTFILAENRIAKKGNKDVYIRLLSPEGKEVSKTGEETEMFNLPNGTRSFYASKETIGYGNQEMTVSQYCESKTGFVPGKYIVMVYNDGVDIGQATVVLD